MSKKINKACAYCGTTSVKRTKGHVLSRSIYPETMQDAERIVIPECEDCKKSWENAEPHFRNILLAIWDKCKLPQDSRVSKMMRSFDKVDGKKRAVDVLKQIKETTSGDKIYPLEDKQFYLVLRKIVRGLSYHHEIETAVSDARVLCIVATFQIPVEFQDSLHAVTIGPDFFKYKYAQLFETGISSFWELCFSKHIKFYATVSEQASA